MRKSMLHAKVVTTGELGVIKSNLPQSDAHSATTVLPMLFGEKTIQETHYDNLMVREDASYDEIRTGYHAALLSYHPDKLQKMLETSDPENTPGDKFFKIQKAWEILSNSKSRAMYDNELRASREDVVSAEDIDLKEMMIEDNGEIMDFFFQCRCGDYFSVNSVELGTMGYKLLRNANAISLQTPDDLPASVILPCGSCSMLVRLLINSDIKFPVEDHLSLRNLLSG